MEYKPWVGWTLPHPQPTTTNGGLVRVFDYKPSPIRPYVAATLTAEIVILGETAYQLNIGACVGTDAGDILTLEFVNTPYGQVASCPMPDNVDDMVAWCRMAAACYQSEKRNEH